MLRQTPDGADRANSSWGHPPLPRGTRFLAGMIDFFALLIPEVVAYELITAAQVNRWSAYYQSHPKAGLSASLAKYPNVNAAVFHFYIAIEVLTAAYLIASYLIWGATPGKLALGLRITRLDGSPLSVRAAVLRSVPFWLPLLVGMVTFRTLHIKLKEAAGPP